MNLCLSPNWGHFQLLFIQIIFLPHSYLPLLCNFQYTYSGPFDIVLYVSWVSVNFNFNLSLSAFKLNNFYSSVFKITDVFPLSSAFCHLAHLVTFFLFHTLYFFSSRVSVCFLFIVSIFSVEVSCLFTYYKHNFLYILEPNEIDALKSLSTESNIWVTSGLASVGCLEKESHFLVSFGLYPRRCEWHVLETLDSIIFVPLRFPINFRIRLLTPKKLLGLWLELHWIHRSVWDELASLTHWVSQSVDVVYPCIYSVLK